MQFHFTESELSYIMKQFSYPQLTGVSRHLYSGQQIQNSLYDKGYLINFSSGEELSNPVRILLSAWTKARYSIVRTDCNSEENSLFILANEDVILFVANFEQQVSVEMLDFTEHNMDLLIEKYLHLDTYMCSSSSFNITVKVDEYINLFLAETKADKAQIMKQLGLPMHDVDFLCSVAQAIPKLSLIVQDMKLNVGCLNMIHIINNQPAMVKHITPSNSDMERVVLVKGDLQEIINSIYIL